MSIEFLLGAAIIGAFIDVGIGVTFAVLAVGYLIKEQLQDIASAIREGNTEK